MIVYGHYHPCNPCGLDSHEQCTCMELLCIVYHVHVHVCIYTLVIQLYVSTHRQQSSNHNTTEGAILRHEVLTGIANQLSQATVRKSPIINCALILLFHQLVPGPQ